jgi:hypothetical protein
MSKLDLINSNLSIFSGFIVDLLPVNVRPAKLKLRSLDKLVAGIENNFLEMI